jgi:ABC-type Fe3+ transport system permease subunit
VGKNQFSESDLAGKLPEDVEVEISLMRAQAGIKFCYIVFILVALMLICIFIYLFVSMSGIKLSEATKESLEVYKEARGLVMEEAMKISDQLLAKVLLPVLTLLLGYIFGREKK